MVHGTDDISAAESYCKTLLKVATPKLYRENTFRVLGLPVNVPLHNIERHQKKLKMAAKLGIDSANQNSGYLPLDPPPDQDAMRHAIERLRDPEKRLIDEFFWFWPTKTGLFGNEALDLLSKNRVDEVINIWKQEEKKNDGCGVSTHNIAILYHLIALDIELKSTAKPLLGEELDKCQSCWTKALAQWQKLLDDVSFWKLLIDRIRNINDPRLTAETAKHTHDSLPYAILLINAKLAVLAAEQNDKDTVERHIQLMKEFDLDGYTVNTALHEAAAPIRQRIKILCTSVPDKAKENPGAANQFARNLLTETQPLLEVVDMLAPRGSSTIKSLHDEISKVVRDCTIIYGNEAADWKECLWLLEQILHIAIGSSLRIRLREDIASIKKNIKDEEIFGNLKLIDKAPTLGTVFGIGLNVYGHTDIDVDTKSYLTTYYFTVLAIPLFPLCRYRVIPITEGYRFLGKAPLRTFDKWHLAISVALIAVIALSIMFNSGSGYSSGSTYSNSNKTYGTKDNYSNTKKYATKYGGQSLLSKINTGKANLKKMESELKNLDVQAESLSIQINTLKTKIKRWELDAARGAYVNEYSYKQALDKHNKLVEQYNSILTTSKTKYTSYEKELKRINDMVNRYNRRSY